MYNKYELFDFTSHNNAGLKHDSLGSYKIKFSRKILISLAAQTQCLLISALFLESSYAYPAKNLIETGKEVAINIASLTEATSLQSSTQSPNAITSQATTNSLEKIADNSQIAKSISPNAQGAGTKTYRIKPASASSKADTQNQINKLNMNTMKWESELRSIELPKSGSHNSMSNSKLR